MRSARPDWQIRFALRPLEDIEPWGEPGDLSLSWFALTDGYYLMLLGDAEVYRYDSAAYEVLGWPAVSEPEGFEYSVDYQVCRLFHDITYKLPGILEREGVRLDPKDLRKQHIDNFALWSAALNGPPRITDWSVVRAAMLTHLHSRP